MKYQISHLVVVRNGPWGRAKWARIRIQRANGSSFVHLASDIRELPECVALKYADITNDD